MSDADPELSRRLVVGHKRDGRCRYDPVAKRELVEAALRPGVSVAGLALRYGINANLLRTWMREHQGHRQAAAPSAAVAPLPAFIPVVPAEPASRAGLPDVAVRLHNGVRIELGTVEPPQKALFCALLQLRRSAGRRLAPFWLAWGGWLRWTLPFPHLGPPPGPVPSFGPTG
jgi:transposase